MAILMAPLHCSGNEILVPKSSRVAPGRTQPEASINRILRSVANPIKAGNAVIVSGVKVAAAILLLLCTFPRWVLLHGMLIDDDPAPVHTRYARSRPEAKCTA